MTVVVTQAESGSAAVGPGEPLFDLRDVGYVYSSKQVALEGVTLSIWPGERVVLLGANGSGKSTLLKLLDGIVGPSSGVIRALGLDIAAVAAGEDGFRFHREVGLVFQDPDIQLFSATVMDDVAFGPLQLGLTRDEVRTRCDEAMAEMGIAHLANRAPFELSGGEKKRAAIASVLSLRPEVVLLDEPTAALDPRTKWVLVDLIQRLSAAGRTLIVATHELEIVPLIADRVIVLNEQGRVVADGPSAVILADTEMLVAANLIHEHLHAHGELAHSHPHESAEGHHTEPGVADINPSGTPVR
ncbi:MAG TPA: ABC transporter ATP-binding protein [Candidatus Limnocylindrales bacterium]